MANSREVVILSGVRTAVGGYGGSLKDQCPGELAGTCIREALTRSGLAPADIGHVVIGNVLHTESRDMYVSRVASVSAGLPYETPAFTVNRLCGSGMNAIVSAAQLVLLGDCDAAVAGGAEVMSHAPYWLPTARFGQRMGDGKMIDPMVGALTDPFDSIHMGVTAENVAEKWGVSREDQDALAVSSHNRAERALDEGRFKEQIVPIEIKSRKGSTMFDTDEHVRRGCTLADLEKLRTVFKKDGTVTAGNASGINDAASALVLMERAAAEARGLKPMARMVGYAFAGVDPKYMGIGPVPAVRTLLEKTGVAVGDIDVFEVNEAFAAQALAVARDLDLPSDRLNPNGSGVSLGHPIGATGSIITVKALYELQRIDGRYALVTMCIGGGQGIAALFESL
jgi:acetyl-CoA C-acetyltransferase